MALRGRRLIRGQYYPTIPYYLLHIRGQTTLLLVNRGQYSKSLIVGNNTMQQLTMSSFLGATLQGQITHTPSSFLASGWIYLNKLHSVGNMTVCLRIFFWIAFLPLIINMFNAQRPIPTLFYQIRTFAFTKCYYIFVIGIHVALSCLGIVIIPVFWNTNM